MNFKKKIFVNLLIICLVFLGLCSVYLLNKSLENKPTELYDVKLREEIEEDNLFTMMFEQSNGEYTAVNTDTWPKDMIYNEELSGCLDRNGIKIKDSLAFEKETGTAIVTVGETSYCYIYFDIKYTVADLCESGENLGTCLIDNREKLHTLSNDLTGGLYRYQGTQEDVTNNYICFGTSDKEECINNTDAYMYRIMGIDESGQVKLIKKEALNEAIEWNVGSTDVIWPSSSLYNNLNGDTFLNNEIYVSSSWKEKIALVSWKYGNIEYSYDIGKGQNQSGINIYEIENAWLDTIDAKIGLMYLYDYYLGYNNEINCSATSSVCKTSWIYLWHKKNDDKPPYKYEWLLTQHTKGGSWIFGETGGGSSYPQNYISAVRPVFYLTSNELYISGSGGIADPIIIS